MASHVSVPQSVQARHSWPHGRAKCVEPQPSWELRCVFQLDWDRDTVRMLAQARGSQAAGPKRRQMRAVLEKSGLLVPAKWSLEQTGLCFPFGELFVFGDEMTEMTEKLRPTGIDRGERLR